MSTKHAKILSAGSGLQENDSVYDFLYQDARRIGSFLSQFDKDGHLTALVRTRSVSEAAGSTFSTGGGVGIPSVANLNATGTQNTADTMGDTAAKTYDPLWQNSLALLDYLEQRDLICRQLSGAKIGQIALLTGKIVVMDTTVIKAIITSKRGAEAIAKGIVESEARKETTKKTKSEIARDQLLTSETIQAVFQSLPTTVSTHLIGKDFGVWSSLGPDGLSVTVDDLLLKHGASPSGEWNMLGIVDALPDTGEPKTDPYFDDGTIKAIADLFTNVRPKFGRPTKAYAMTPLLIFRKVIGSCET